MRARKKVTFVRGELAFEHVRSLEIKESCIAISFTSEAYIYPDMLLLSRNTRKKVTFLGFTNPDEGDF